MLFSVNYHSKYLNDADEIKCPYNQLRQLYDHMRQFPNKRYVVVYSEEQNTQVLIQQIDILKDIVKNYTIECSSIIELKALLHAGYPAYLKYYICDWETVQSLIALGVSDIYIDSSIAFQMKNIKKLCSANNVKIRVSPTVSPNASLLGLQPNSFFIRPEDMDLYEKYIDVIDFKMVEQDKEDTLFQIYKRGTFYYNLNELLDNCKFSVLNPFIKPEFGQARLNCGQKCLIPGHSCHLCETQVQLTNLVYSYFKDRQKEQESKVETSLQ